MTDHERTVVYWRAFKAALPPTSIEAIAAEVGERLGLKLSYATVENAVKRAIDPDDPTGKDRPNQKVPASALDAVLREVLPAPPTGGDREWVTHLGVAPSGDSAQTRLAHAAGLMAVWAADGPDEQRSE